METTRGKASTRAKNKYNSANYDNLRIVVPKGRKQTVEARALEAGESVNGYVNGLIRADLGLSEAEWKHLPEGEENDEI